MYMDCTCTSLVSELLRMFKWYFDKTRQLWTSLEREGTREGGCKGEREGGREREGGSERGREGVREREREREGG